MCGRRVTLTSFLPSARRRSVLITQRRHGGPRGGTAQHLVAGDYRAQIRRGDLRGFGQRPASGTVGVQPQVSVKRGAPGRCPRQDLNLRSGDEQLPVLERRTSPHPKPVCTRASSATPSTSAAASPIRPAVS